MIINPFPRGKAAAALPLAAAASAVVPAAAAGTMPQNPMGELLEIIYRAALRAALRMCCMPEEHIANIERRQRHDSGARLICYLDGMSEELVHRQLEFRKEHKMKRVASRTSMSSLSAVSESSELMLGSHGSRPKPSSAMQRTMSTPASMSSLDGSGASPIRRNTSGGSGGAGRVRASSSDEQMKQMNLLGVTGGARVRRASYGA